MRADDAPEPVGPYSQAVIVGGTVYVSGQLPLEPESGRLVAGGIDAQVEQVMKNISAILGAAGAGLSDVCLATVYLARLEDIDAVNQGFMRYFGPVFPARATIQAARLPMEAAIEIAVIAEREECEPA